MLARRFALIVLALGLMPGAASAQKDLPKGTYRASCISCVITGNGVAMQCNCRTGDGDARAFAVADLRACASKSYSNRSGKLVCDPALMASGSEPLPAGSYKKSCHTCTRKGSTLSCMCESHLGVFVRTTFDYGKCNPKRVYNDSGLLKCERR